MLATPLSLAHLQPQETFSNPTSPCMKILQFPFLCPWEESQITTTANSRPCPAP